MLKNKAKPLFYDLSHSFFLFFTAANINKNPIYDYHFTRKDI